MALAASATHQPLVFPSLGPTAFLLFYRPHGEASCPRNALLGHLIGALAGLGALAAFGLLGHGPALNYVSASRIGAAAVSLGVTAAAMIWLGTPHPPAGATTLIISLGFLHTPTAVAVLMLGVALLVVQGFVVNRWAGIGYPAWAPHQRPRPLPTAAGPSAGDPSLGGGLPMYKIFVDAFGDSPAGESAQKNLRAVLGGQTSELTCAAREWTGIFLVEAADIEQAVEVVSGHVTSANAAAELPDWDFHCYELRETVIRLDDDVPHWALQPPHWLPHLPHGHRGQRHAERRPPHWPQRLAGWHPHLTGWRHGHSH